MSNLAVIIQSILHYEPFNHTNIKMYCKQYVTYLQYICSLFHTYNTANGWMCQTSYWFWCQVRWLFLTWLIMMDYLRSSLLKFKCSEGSWEHGQQSRSLRQSTERSVVNLNVRSLIWRQKVFGGYPPVFPTLLCTCSPSAFIRGRSVCIHFLSSSHPSLLGALYTVVACLVLLTWTMVPLPLSC